MMVTRMAGSPDAGEEDDEGEADLPYAVKLEIGDTFTLADAFAEKGAQPAEILSVEMEDGSWRLSEIRSLQSFTVDQRDCDHEGKPEPRARSDLLSHGETPTAAWTWITWTFGTAGSDRYGTIRVAARRSPIHFLGWEERMAGPRGWPRLSSRCFSSVSPRRLFCGSVPGSLVFADPTTPNPNYTRTRPGGPPPGRRSHRVQHRRDRLDPQVFRLATKPVGKTPDLSLQGARLLVNMTGSGGAALVVPGSRDQSLLFRKVAGTHANNEGANHAPR
jgi:hypothetical protein